MSTTGPPRTAATGAAVAPPAKGADGFYHPASEDELIALVVKAGREHRQCRVRGAAHSVSHAIYSDPLEEIGNRTSHQRAPEGRNIDIMLDLYRGMRVVDPERKIVEADAGIHLGEDPSDPTGTATEKTSLLWLLWQQGWTFSNLGGITHQTVSGFSGMGSSGGSVQHSFNENIYGFRVIDAGGTVHEFTRDSDPDAFHAMSPNLGLLGVVSKMSFICEDAYNIGGKETVTGEDDCAIDLFGRGGIVRPSMERFLRDTEYARLLWWPQLGAERVEVWQAERLAPDPDFVRHPYEEFTSHPELAEVAISVIYTILGNLHDLSRTKEQFRRARQHLRVALPKRSPFNKLGPLGSLLALVLSACFGIAVFLIVTLLRPLTGFVEPRIPKLFPKLLTVFIKLDSEKKGKEKGQPQHFQDHAWLGLPMDDAADDVLLPTDFTEIWLPLSRAEEAMQLLRSYFRDVKSVEESYARTGLYGWELYAAQATPFWMSASHSDGEDEWQEGVFRIDPYWFGANPGDPIKSFYLPLWNAFRESGIPFRLHWGKYQPEIERGDRVWVNLFKSQYPKWDEFLKLREQRDPKGIFLTSYWKQRFGL